MPDPAPQSPAARFAAVLKILLPQWAWNILTTAEHQSVYAGRHKGDDPQPPDDLRFDPASKDDLARVVAMLTNEQIGRFNIEFGVMLTPWAYITSPVSYWLDALVAATGMRVT